MPFDVPGGGPLNPSSRGQQSTTFSEQPIEGVSGESAPFSGATELFEENEVSKKPFPVGPVAGGLAIIAAIIFILMHVFSAGGDQRTIGDFLEDPPPVEGDDGWESAEGGQDGLVTIPTPQYISQYTPEQHSELRAYGYTGDEIEQFQADGADYQKLLDDTLSKQAAQQIKIYNYLLKNSLASTDEAYTTALSMSWLGLPIPDIDPGEYDALGNPMSEYLSEQRKENVNYWKVPVAGNQCLLKLKLDDGTIVFYVTTPMDYLEKKKDYGNMVITYKRISYRGSYYITDIVEIEI